DHPVWLRAEQCPELATEPVEEATDVVSLGRLHDGRISTTDLFVSEAVAVSDGAGAGFPFAYDAQAVIAQGDSGGPIEEPGTWPHRIVAVASGAYPGRNEVLARVDLLNSQGNAWIADQIRTHGGSCSSSP